MNLHKLLTIRETSQVIRRVCKEKFERPLSFISRYLHLYLKKRVSCRHLHLLAFYIFKLRFLNQSETRIAVGFLRRLVQENGPLTRERVDLCRGKREHPPIRLQCGSLTPNDNDTALGGFLFWVLTRRECRFGHANSPQWRRSSFAIQINQYALKLLFVEF